MPPRAPHSCDTASYAKGSRGTVWYVLAITAVARAEASLTHEAARGRSRCRARGCARRPAPEWRARCSEACGSRARWSERPGGEPAARRRLARVHGTAGFRVASSLIVWYTGMPARAPHPFEAGRYAKGIVATIHSFLLFCFRCWCLVCLWDLWVGLPGGYLLLTAYYLLLTTYFLLTTYYLRCSTTTWHPPCGISIWLACDHREQYYRVARPDTTCSEESSEVCLNP